MHFEVAPELLMSKGTSRQTNRQHTKRLVERERLAARSLKSKRGEKEEKGKGENEKKGNREKGERKMRKGEGRLFY